MNMGRWNAKRLTRSLPAATAERLPSAGGLPAMSIERRLALVCLGLAAFAWNGWAADRSEDDKLWAFQRVRRIAPPAVHAASWGRNPIDAFILSGLERAGLPPAPEASRETLIRRVT